MRPGRTGRDDQRSTPSRGRGLIAPDARLLRAAGRLALDVALQGELADPPVPSPALLRPLLGFRKLTRASSDTIIRVLEQDDGFRARVAEVADEAEVGRAGYLWLTRPEGWEDDPAIAGATDDTSAQAIASLVRERDAAQSAADRFRSAADEARGRARRAEEQARQARSELAEVQERSGDLEIRISALEEARAEALRLAKEHETALATTRHDLKVAREAARQAEAELLGAGRAAPSSSSPPGTTEPESTAPTPDPAVDLGGVAEALDRIEVAVHHARRTLTGTDDGEGERTGEAVGAADRAALRRVDRRRRPRRRTGLPPGLTAGTPEADRHLVSAPNVLVVVDGYNLARLTWSGLEPEEERRRTVALLEEAAARSGGEVVAYFDGDQDVISPPASRSVRVRYSPRGVTADDAIAQMVRTVALERPVVVVSSDRQVQDDARRQGATPMTSAAYLAAVRR